MMKGPALPGLLPFAVFTPIQLVAHPGPRAHRKIVRTRRQLEALETRGINSLPTKLHGLVIN